MTTRKPNILFILADDLGWGDVGWHGSSIKTPTLDHLAKIGLELTNHYVCPVCTPTRASLLSGRFASRFGEHATQPSNAPVFPDNYATLPVVLREGGYDTGLFGKWHLGSAPEYGPNVSGFDTAYGSLAGGVDPYNHRYKKGKYSKTWHRNGETVEEPGHATDLIVDKAIQWIESRKNPWFCYLPFTAVHFPVKAPQEYINLYAGETFDEDPEKDRSYRTYAAYASHMDGSIGRLLDTLDRLCNRENTVVVFTSDNGATPKVPATSTCKYPGYQPGSPLLGSNLPWRGIKGQLYEGAIRTPTILYWADHIQPGTSDTICQIADWMPTLCQLTGCQPLEDPSWDGADIWSQINNDSESSDDERLLYWNLRGNQFAIRKGKWKLILREKEGTIPLELFDLETDPYETTDLSDAEPEVVQGTLRAYPTTTRFRLYLRPSRSNRTGRG